MRHSIIVAIFVASCSGTMRASGSAATSVQAPASAAPDPPPPAVEPEREPIYPDGLVAMVGAAPQWFEGPWASEVRMGRIHAALVVNGKPVVVMDTDEQGKPKARRESVKNGTERAEASLLGPQELAFLMVGPGPYMVKTLCYQRGPDGSFVLFGGGIRRRSEMRIVGVHCGIDCRPIAAAAVAP